MNIDKLKKLNQIYSIGLSNLDKFTLVFIGIILGLIEMLSLGLIVKISQEILEKNGFIIFGISINDQKFIVALLISLLLVKFLINLTAIRFQVSIIFNAIGSLSLNMLKSYFYGPIEDVYGERKGNATRNVFNEPTMLGVGVYLPTAIVISETLICILLLIQLFFLNILFAIPVFFCFIISSRKFSAIDNPVQVLPTPTE